METAAINDKVQNLWEEVRELSLGTTIDRLETPPTPLEFLRHYVSHNRPFIVSNATHHWPATDLWKSPSYLLNTLSSSIVSLHLTPTGRADSMTACPSLPSPSLCFASACVKPTLFPEAISAILDSRSGELVAYLQQQNDCFRSEYGLLGKDCEEHIGWASEAFGCLPEAVNFWVGNELSVTSFHKDHYENLYAVVTGEKHFLLLPPTDVHRMYIREYPAASYSYSQDTREFTLDLEDPLRFVPWCSVNPFPSPENGEKEVAAFPLYFNGPKPFECTVKAGEILYLPSMWFHHVKQTPDENGLTIAVNYWYDMQFDIKYAYFNFVQSVELHRAKCQPCSRATLRSSENESSGGTFIANGNVTDSEGDYEEEDKYS